MCRLSRLLGGFWGSRVKRVLTIWPRGQAECQTERTDWVGKNEGDLLSVPQRLSGLDLLVGCSLGKGGLKGHVREDVHRNGEG